MNFDLNSRSSRLEKEQVKRREEAKKKREQELRAQAGKKRIEEELSELARKRKIEAEIAEEQRRLEEERELASTGGIKYKDSFTEFSLIKESEDDKIILPESALHELTSQDAFGRGAAVFELSLRLPNKPDIIARITHCGVREFSAAPNTLSLPSRVVDTLWEDSDYPLVGIVTVKYIKLPKVTYVKLQPKLNTFFKVEPVKMVLEENLRCHSTLTVGDIVTIWYRGVSHPLRVVEMRPEPKGTLIDTDVEVDLDNSEEHLQKQSSESQKEAGSGGGRILGFSSGSTSTGGALTGTTTVDETLSSASHKRNAGYQLGRTDAATTAAVAASLQPPAPAIATTLFNAPSAAAAQHNAQQQQQQQQQVLSEHLLDLPSEPDLGAANVISVRVKTPTGGTLSRRFLTHHSLKLLFVYVSAQTGLQQGALQLSTRFPARVFSLDSISSSSSSSSEDGVSFVDAGITASQETFMATAAPSLKSH